MEFGLLTTDEICTSISFVHRSVMSNLIPSHAIIVIIIINSSCLYLRGPYFKSRENFMKSVKWEFEGVSLQLRNTKGSHTSDRCQCFCSSQEMSILLEIAPETIDGHSKTISVPIVQELAAKQHRELPERYITPEEDRPSLVEYSPKYGIPVIDMGRVVNSVSDEDRQTEMKKFAMACEEWGFFQVVNHGIPSSLMGRMRGIARRFFQLPLEERKEHAMIPGSGSEGYGQLFVASEDQRLDWADLLFLMTLPTENRKMRFWPTKPAGFRETVAEYVTETQKLGDNLLSLLAENLGLRQRGYFVHKCGKWWQSMRINNYPPCPRPDLALGLSPHSDGSGITVLLQDEQTEGLQIRKDGEWIGVQIIPDALVINIGDLMEVMSNGRYKSVEHRAVTNKEKGRTSIAVFYTPGMEAEIGPPPDLIDELHPCLYRTFKRREFSQHYFANRLEGKRSIEFLKVCASH